MLHIPVLVSVTLGSVGLAPFYAAVRRQRIFQPAAFPKTMDEMMVEASDKAVARARSRYAITLDYSMDSIRNVESIMGKAYELYRAAPQLVDARSMAFVFGAYVGETIRRNNPACSWERSNEVGAEDFYTLYRGDRATFPMAWCMKCITEGAVDDARVIRNKAVIRHVPKVEVREIPKVRSATAGAY
jgi:hypothetical protein